MMHWTPLYRVPSTHGTLLYSPLPKWEAPRLTVQVSPFPLPPSQPQPHVAHPLLVASDGHHWRPVQTYSLQDPFPLVAIEAHMVGASRRYASCWNAFLGFSCWPSLKYLTFQEICRPTTESRKHKRPTLLH